MASMGMNRFCVSSVLAAGLLACVPGCNIVGPAMVMLTPPPSNEALFELDESRTHMVFIDDLKNRVPKRSLRDLMAESAEGAILQNEALSQDKLVSAKSTQRAAAEDRFGSTLPVAEIGKRAGVDVVIYVTMDTFSLTKDGTTAAPNAVGRVKVIDVQNNARLWPGLPEGYILRVAPQMQQGNLPNGLAERSALEQDLARRFGVSLGQMFFKHLTENSARN